ncbi:MAG: electron transfer flavoprotein subunit alpha/FixB family protein [Syntrophomonas sp.]
MAGILIFSEKTKSALELASAAHELSAVNPGEIYALCINEPQEAEELSARGLAVYSLENPGLSTADTAGTAAALLALANKLGVDTILLSSDRRGKELAGRVAEAWEAGCLTDVKGFSVQDGQVAFVRNALGGATVATQIIKTDRKLIAFTPRAFAPFEGGGGSILPFELESPAPSVKVLEVRSKAGDMVDIQGAERLVIVGQGVENQADLSIVEQVAKALGAEIACSKPVASDKKWMSEERIVGLSGKICKPEAAIILGVSGQVQFTVGVREAQVIFSINNDENAYMNKISDYILVADLKDALPELAKALA